MNPSIHNFLYKEFNALKKPTVPLDCFTFAHRLNKKIIHSLRDGFTKPTKPKYDPELRLEITLTHVAHYFAVGARPVCSSTQL